jgi:hypothetical protein
VTSNVKKGATAVSQCYTSEGKSLIKIILNINEVQHTIQEQTILLCRICDEYSIQTNLKDYERERLPIHIPATGSVSYKITVSLHHTSTLIPLQQH